LLAGCEIEEAARRGPGRALDDETFVNHEVARGGEAVGALILGTRRRNLPKSRIGVIPIRRVAGFVLQEARARDVYTACRFIACGRLAVVSEVHGSCTMVVLG